MPPHLPLIRPISVQGDPKRGGRVAASAIQTVMCGIARCWHAYRERHQREQLHAILSRLSERELKDIGVTPAEIAYLAAYRDHDRLRDNARSLGMHSGL